MSFLTQSHQVFFGRPLLSNSFNFPLIQRLTQSLSSPRQHVQTMSTYSFWSSKMHKNLLVTTLKIIQLLGDFVPRPPTGASPLDPVVLPPSQTSFRRLCGTADPEQKLYAWKDSTAMPIHFPYQSFWPLTVWTQRQRISHNRMPQGRVYRLWWL